MAGLHAAVVICLLAGVSALPAPDPVLFKWSSDLRYQYMQDAEGGLHLVDHWVKASDMASAARYNPIVDNAYHLFTRANPQVSQPMYLNSNAALAQSNYNADRRTIILIHGFLGSATAPINSVIVPAYLQAEDVNVFVLDWSRGAGILSGTPAYVNAIASGISGANFVDWIRAQTGTSINNFHVLAHSLGAHKAAVMGRNVNNGRLPYITALDPGANMEPPHIFGPDCGTYTEAIHTNAGVMGHGSPLAHADFYPNGGDLMPGCGINFLCNHDRAIHYMGETLTTNAGFTGTRCATYVQARAGLCLSPGPLRMGGRTPKTGQSGLFHLTTNAAPPFNTG